MFKRTRRVRCDLPFVFVVNHMTVQEKVHKEHEEKATKDTK
jgi:hypothetical protein